MRIKIIEGDKEPIFKEFKDEGELIGYMENNFEEDMIEEYQAVDDFYPMWIRGEIEYAQQHLSISKENEIKYGNVTVSREE